MMECDACRSKLLEYLEGDLTGPAQADLQTHLTQCPGCREELEGLQETLALIARIPVPEPPEAFWQQYLRELRQKVAAPPWPARLQHWLAGFTLRPIPALAVGIALMLAVFLTWNTPTVQPPAPPVASLDLTEQLALSQDLDLLREMDLLESLELLEDLDVIEFRDIPDRQRAV
ncbi:MAG: zf-HC2 domain-containing protein [Candidatus Methylomirabilales bacterium]